MNKFLIILFALFAASACRPYSQETVDFEPSTLGNIPDSTTLTFGTDYTGNIQQVSVFITKNNVPQSKGFLAQAIQNQLVCNDANAYRFVFRGADTYNYVATTVGNVAKREEAKQWQGSFSASKDSACKTILLDKTKLLPLNERAKVQFWLQAGTSLNFQSGDTTTIYVSIFRADNSKVVQNVPLLATATSFRPLCEPSNNYPFAILSLPLGDYFAQVNYAGTSKTTGLFSISQGVCTIVNL